MFLVPSHQLCHHLLQYQDKMDGVGILSFEAHNRTITGKPAYPFIDWAGVTTKQGLQSRCLHLRIDGKEAKITNNMVLSLKWLQAGNNKLGSSGFTAVEIQRPEFCSNGQISHSEATVALRHFFRMYISPLTHSLIPETPEEGWF